MNSTKLSVAVIVPCHNEEATVRKVILDFKRVLPDAKIYIFDNNSKDNTADIALKSGAIVRFVKARGKGNVVRRMFADINSDIYVMVDGDDTYDIESAPKLIKKLTDDKLDMVIGSRVEDSTENNNYRAGHRMGNKLLTKSVQKMFGGDFTDMLSGYRVFSKRFVKSFPAESQGFEIETELTVFALEMRIPYAELATKYSERPEGSESKLSTYKDGWKILKMIFFLYSTELPLRFWSMIGGFLIIISTTLSIPIFLEFLHSHTVSRFPTLIISSGLAVSGFMAFTIGIVLRTVTKGRREAKQLAYLSVPAVKSNYSDK